ncbi:hypothetical protein AcV5_007976 [Taiwanofungus camphoratus]|nr:hypothetical protein AcV5_007976 [Antrodia cinnamomea]
MNATSKDTWSATSYNKTAAFVYSQAFTSPVLTLLDAKPGERIIDFGCGSGEVTLQIKKLVGDAGLVVGCDSSESMITQCKANGVEHAFIGDAQALRFPLGWDASHQEGFDAVFSNAALHWCKRDPKGVLESAKKVLRRGGRFVIEMGGYMNCVGVRSALHHVLRTRGYDPIELDPWYFPSVEDYKLLLESSGFDVQTISLHPRITPLTGSLVDWLRLFCRPYFLRGMADEEAEGIMQAVQDICNVDCQDKQGTWAIMYSRLRVVATLR